MDSQEATVIYHYDPVTLLYVGAGTAHVGPRGDVQIPAFSSLVPPGDVPSGKAAQAQAIEDGHATAWTLIDDWRTTPVYRTDDGSRYELGAPLGDTTWNGLGAIPDGLTDVPKPDGYYAWDGAQWAFDLATARTAAVAAVDTKRDEMLASPFIYDCHAFSADAGSVIQIASTAHLAAVAKLAGQPYFAVWPSVSGVDVQLDADGMIGLAMAAAARLQPIQQIASQLKDQVAAANDEAALAAIVWPAQ